MKRQILLEIKGNVPSKKNNYKRAKYGGMYKPKEILNFEESFLWQVKGQKAKFKVNIYPFENPVNIKAKFICDSYRPDLDNKFTTCQDLLVKANIIKNDNLKSVSGFSVEGEKGDENITYLIIEEV